MNLATSTLPNFGSGKISRLGTSRRRGITTPSVQLGMIQMNHPLRLPYYLRRFLDGTTTYLPFKSDKNDLLQILQQKSIED
jgi:hypothetical protein